MESFQNMKIGINDIDLLVIKSAVATYNHRSRVGNKYPGQFQYFKHNIHVIRKTYKS